MMSTCARIAARLVAPGKGILAADESIGTMSGRLVGAGVAATEDNRRAYRELLASAPGLADGVSGIIFCDETLRQRFADGRTFPDAVRAFGVLPGVKVDTGAKPCPGLPGETVTEGLDGLAERLAEYASLGAAFAKWRAVLTIAGELPSTAGIRANAHALARYAAACQQEGLVPIVEPEVLMDGDHSLRRCAEVTARVHAALMAELAAFGVDPAGILLKPNMVVEGATHAERSTPEQVAEATVAVLRALPTELAGVAFLSGGQPPTRATANLAAMQEHRTPWPLTFSFGRALVDPALAAWAGDPARVGAGQAALGERVAANAAAVRRRAELQPA
ncbi:MAG TPA: class I fructose-bisphosphate aldolase [Pseudonocardia sp.]|uniref:class I fructose-bisphosphate aldolase n=1 Tax=Pseudonocardia sp. TaxID=60912 RepID=UPI002CA06A62|nr:class I fructose-bisphosphate aldolase [Pseudonocardia sp.]HTF54045.1 class I fructose-bisphosphate aldolase [Pseudonocardia sp.]